MPVYIRCPIHIPHIDHTTTTAMDLNSDRSKQRNMYCGIFLSLDLHSSVSLV